MEGRQEFLLRALRSSMALTVSMPVSQGVRARVAPFWDSVLDPYADGAMMAGLIVYLMRFSDLLSSEPP